jgi:hypothetical protein
MSGYLGRAEEALARAETAVRLNPRDPLAFRNNIAVILACEITHDWERLLANAEQGLALNPRALAFYRAKAIALTRLGRDAEAAVARQRHMEAAPSFRTAAYVDAMRTGVGVVEAVWRPVLEGLRAAGFPD